jgi:hypothetical protein
VPFTLFDNRMLIQASIDGKGPFTMIVDTGSTSVVVTPDVAQRLELQARAAGSATGAGSGSMSLAVTRLTSLAIGALQFDNLRAEVLDLSAIRRAIGFPRLDGIVGYDILSRLRVGVDMDAARLTLSYAITGIGVGGPVYSDVLRTTVSVFGSTISGVVTRAPRDRGGAFALGQQAASLGTGLLKRFNIVYDYPDKQLFAWPSRFFALPDVYRPLVLENGTLHVAPAASDPTVLPSPR